MWQFENLKMKGISGMIKFSNHQFSNHQIQFSNFQIIKFSNKYK